jgi:hypothetical protein
MIIRNIGSNQTEVTQTNGTRILVSYETPVAAYVPGIGYLRTTEHQDGRPTVTTTKHIRNWIDGASSQTVTQAEIEALM